MYKGGKIIASLIIFVAVLISPFIYNMGKANAGPENLDANLKLVANTQCVEPASYMLANHMKLLDQWRLAYIRDGQTVYTNSQGQKYAIDINTCITCHSTGKAPVKAGVISPVLASTGVSNPALASSGVSNPAQTTTEANNNENFCVSCHNYSSVEPTCWSCHSQTGGVSQ